MITETRELQTYLEAFSQSGARRGSEPAWLREMREDAFALFCQKGFPTTKDEDWRFTNVAKLAQTPFQVADPVIRVFDPGQLDSIPGAACRLVFVNGRFAPQLSQLGSLPVGVEVGSLRSALARVRDPFTRVQNPYHDSILESHLGRYLDVKRDAFCALNTALFEDGLYVHIPRRVVLRAPIHALFVSTPGGAPAMAHTRNLIFAEAESQASIVEDYVSFGDGPFFSNAATEVVAGEDAVLAHYLLEREGLEAYNVSTLRLEQARSANLSSHSVLLGGGLVRNNVHPVLAGEGAECLINGLFFGKDRQHVDNYMLVEHASPHCNSRQFYNGILDGRAHGVFHGRIIVHQDAQKTDAKQTNRNLLLSDDAQIDTKPQLEIYADDVKCTHGATIGQVEENALFYLRSRGIDEASARRLLLFAFASQCLERMRDEGMRAYLDDLVQRWLPENEERQKEEAR